MFNLDTNDNSVVELEEVQPPGFASWLVGFVAQIFFRKNSTKVSALQRWLASNEENIVDVVRFRIIDALFVAFLLWVTKKLPITQKFTLWLTDY